MTFLIIFRPVSVGILALSAALTVGTMAAAQQGFANSSLLSRGADCATQRFIGAGIAAQQVAAQRAAGRHWAQRVRTELPAAFANLRNADPNASEAHCAPWGNGHQCRIHAAPCRVQQPGGPFQPW